VCSHVADEAHFWASDFGRTAMLIAARANSLGSHLGPVELDAFLHGTSATGPSLAASCNGGGGGGGKCACVVVVGGNPERDRDDEQRATRRTSRAAKAKVVRRATRGW
jgi:hypothetical protein